MKYLLTPERFELLRKMIEQATKSANQAATEGFQSGAEQDGHHDEGYQLSLRETAVKDRRLQNLQEIYGNAQIVTPAEQSDVVDLGNGVVLAYPDGRKLKCVMEGYVLEELRGNRVSIQSPLGRAIRGAKAGEHRKFSIKDREITVMVEKIYPPSKAEEVYE